MDNPFTFAAPTWTVPAYVPGQTRILVRLTTAASTACWSEVNAADSVPSQSTPTNPSSSTNSVGVAAAAGTVSATTPSVAITVAMTVELILLNKRDPPTRRA